jgi:hypothetical protein
MAKKTKITKKMLQKAYDLGHWNEYLYDLVFQEGVDHVQSNFPELSIDDDFDSIQELVDAFVAGFHGTDDVYKK